MKKAYQIDERRAIEKFRSHLLNDHGAIQMILFSITSFAGGFFRSLPQRIPGAMSELSKRPPPATRIRGLHRPTRSPPPTGPPCTDGRSAGGQGACSPPTPGTFRS
jgi:hypothetical protein